MAGSAQHRDELMVAFDEWEAAADALDLMMSDRARGVPIAQKCIDQMKDILTLCQARWDELARQVQPH